MGMVWVQVPAQKMRRKYLSYECQRCRCDKLLELPEEIYLCFLDREVMRNLSTFLKMMGDATTASITIDNITGVMTKLLPNNPTNIRVGIATNGDMKVCLTWDKSKT